MNDDPVRDAEVLSMFVKFERGVDPEVFADLKSLPKGSARVQRLRLLAALGLRGERKTRPHDVDRPGRATRDNANSSPASASVRGMFDEPIDD
jgi:hypothetical protein